MSLSRHSPPEFEVGEAASRGGREVGSPRTKPLKLTGKASASQRNRLQLLGEDTFPCLLTFSFFWGGGGKADGSTSCKRKLLLLHIVTRLRRGLSHGFKGKKQKLWSPGLYLKPYPREVTWSRMTHRCPVEAHPCWPCLRPAPKVQAGSDCHMSIRDRTISGPK